MAEISLETDVLVIGSGFAGNRAALGAADGGAKVLQVTLGAGGSPNIMGFSASVVDGDSVEVVFSDIMSSGMGVNDPALTRAYANGTAELVKDFEDLGVPFKKDDSGKIVPLHSLGTKFPRLVHQYQCMTGHEIQKALNKKIQENKNITVRINTMVTDLLVDKGRVLGACGIDTLTGEFIIVKSRVVVVATGGSGRAYAFTTYPKDVTGDGMAMAYRAGLPLADMELLQFEPCCFVAPPQIRGYVNPTTFLKMGAQLKNNKGETLFTDFSTIQKDMLARKMLEEIKAGRGTSAGGIYYDVTMIPEETVKVNHYVHYQPALIEGGIDICKEVSEVAPAGHSFQGGVAVNPDCSTEIQGLYIAGEAMGGVHGANRMGGDSGGAALVFGKIVGKTVAKDFRNFDVSDLVTVEKLAGETESVIKSAQSKKGACPGQLKAAIQNMMQEKVGIIKTEESLTSAEKDLDQFEAEFSSLEAKSIGDLRDLLTVRNMLITARAMMLCSKGRNESRGVHYRGDYPARNDAEWFGKNVFVRKGSNGKMEAQVVKRKQ
jgi:succinate dehydrogenase/fumarate reductase flavoprotein subunit